MVDTAVAAMVERIETRADIGSGEAGEWAYWMGQEAIAEKAESSWRKRGRMIVRRYRDERSSATTGSTATTHRFNILWSNVQTLIPTLYGRTPKPDVERRFKDQDDTGRLASTLLERCLGYSMGKYDFDTVMRAVVQDRLLPGRGIARVLYVPHYGDAIPDDDNEQFEQEGDAAAVLDNLGDEGKTSEPGEGQGDPLREVVYEECCVKYEFWEDYREGPARQWCEVPWIRFLAYMTRDALVERFGKKGKTVNLDYVPKGYREADRDNAPPDMFKKAVVFEFWDKVKKRVVWLAPGTPDLILDGIDDPLTLPDFYPCPDPLLATMTNDTRVPVPDYIEYQDQALELDTLTARIDRLVRALKVSGVYAGAEKQALQQLIDEGTENRLIPVEDWASFASDKGGLDGLIQWMPIQQIAETLIQLYNARDRVKQILYEITGIGDIIRGQGDPGETATAQQLKSNFSTLRIQPQQRETARFARDLIRLMGAVIAMHFDAKTISMITGYPLVKPVPQIGPPPPAVMQGQANPQQPGVPQIVQNPAYAQWMQQYQQAQAIQAQNQQEQAKFDAAVKLLREDAIEGFRIDIEADSTILPDEQAEKENRVEFLSKIIPMMQQVIPLAQGNPALASLAREFTLFAIRGFKVARSLEETVEKAFDAISQMPPDPNAQGGKGQQNGPDTPQALQARMHQTEVQAQTDQAKIAAQQQSDQAKLQFQTMELQQTGQIERAHLALEAQRMVEERGMHQERISAMEARSAKGLT